MKKWDYKSAQEYIEDIPRFTKKKSEESRRLILKHFGDPQESFRYIHVAGTNGKGSVCAYIDRVLENAGIKTGLFTSPHLITMTERMRIDGQMISEEDFTEIFSELYEYICQQRSQDGSRVIHPTYFEWLYIMAMIWFARSGIEYGVIETGLGGRLDATNTVVQPAISIITSISYDHTQILGSTLARIASEKAGIIKRGVPVICDGNEPEALRVIREKAQEMNAPLTVCISGDLPEKYTRSDAPEAADSGVCLSEGSRAGGTGPVYEDVWLVKNILNKGKNIDFYLQEMYHEWDSKRRTSYKIRLHTGARYQAVNSSLALLAVRMLSESDKRLAELSESAVLKDLYDMYWPGRLEELMPGVIVDGAHNAGGAESLCASLEGMYPDRTFAMVFAVAGDKDHRRMINILSRLPGLEYVIVTRIAGSRAADTKQVAEEFRTYLPESVYIEEQPDTGKALAAGESFLGSGNILVCTGSLYLVGSVLDHFRRHLQQKPHFCRK